MAPPTSTLIGDIIACPGLDYCSLANARSIPVAQKISERFAASGKERTLGELKLKISGCINACGHHHAGHIGILGVDRKGHRELPAAARRQRGGGRLARPRSPAPASTRTASSTRSKPSTDVYLREREDGERFLDTYRRIGMEPFKEALYG